ncbi:hypothetical protein CCHOA_02430 [Corynebacterium choanae]|uniref:Uncharacterized protein n=1 Tax=Corynebacterium choanae TaxID=1862358 RepID=A0A3G6J574_9CORY|nr:hypothetical protein CCHOA_02430 [Corynebacterium choanae]
MAVYGAALCNNRANIPRHDDADTQAERGNTLSFLQLGERRRAGFRRQLFIRVVLPAVRAGTGCWRCRRQDSARKHIDVCDGFGGFRSLWKSESL